MMMLKLISLQQNEGQHNERTQLLDHQSELHNMELIIKSQFLCFDKRSHSI